MSWKRLRKGWLPRSHFRSSRPVQTLVRPIDGSPKERLAEKPHRIPPMAIDQDERGNCRWCGLEASDQATWHTECLNEYRLATNWRGRMRKLIKARDQAICAVTGRYDPRWQLDHIQPLFNVDRGLPVRIVQMYFSPANIQTLSLKAHHVKTAREMEMMRGIRLASYQDPIRRGLRSGDLRLPTGLSAKDREFLATWI